MFIRAKKSGAYQYLQLVHNERVNGKVRQQVLATLERLGVLQRSGQIGALIASCGRFAQHTAVLDAHRHGRTAVATTKIGPCLVFERLWKGLGSPEILGALLAGRRFGFAGATRARRYRPSAWPWGPRFGCQSEASPRPTR